MLSNHKTITMDQKQANAIFKRIEKEGGNIDVIYTTFDNQVFYSPVAAKRYADEQTDKTIQEWYKPGEGAVRKLAEDMKGLPIMISTVDFLKRKKLMGKEKPTYEEYVKECEDFNIIPVTHPSYNFMANNVFNAPVRVENRIESILTQSETILPAEYMGVLHGYGKLYKAGHMMVLTCPTNVELMTVNLKDVFKALFTVETVSLD